MASGLYTKRDFQVARTMAWHNLTTLAAPTREHFPNIIPAPLYFGEDCKPMIYGDRKFVVPVAEDDMLPVAPPYCGETVPDDEPKTCPAKPEDTRGTYILFTPREAWDWVHEVLSGTHFEVSSIGMLWNRSFWFIGVTLTELQELTVGGRNSQFQLNFSGGLDRSVSPQCELSSILPVCWNTISLSRAMGKILFAERATKNFATRLDAAKAEVEKAAGMTAVFKAAMDSLADKPCNKPRAERIFAGYLVDEVRVDEKTGKDIPMSTRSSNTVKELAALHVDGIANAGKTEMDLLNAYTQRYTHGGKEAKTTMGRRFVSSEFGSGADTKADFFRLLTTGREALPEIEERGARLLAAN